MKVAAMAGGALLASLVVGAGWFLGGAGRLPRASRSSAADPLEENARCEGCHTEIAVEWRASQHRSSFTDPVFQAALAVEPRPFCRGCHAPEDPGATTEGGAHTLGVGCVTCHLAGDVVLAAPSTGLGLAPHRVARTEAFAGPGACAGCHEFAFDDEDRRDEPLAMQRTVSEHAASAYAAQSCADCHMPRTAAGHRSHAFASTRDADSHRRAVRVEAERAGETGVRLTLSTRGVGHAYPTGDLFRRLAVEAEAVGPDHQRLASARAFLARHFTTGRDRFDDPIRVESHDDRVGAEAGAASVAELDLGERARGRPIRYRVSLDRVLHVADHREASAVVPDRVVLAEGEVEP